MTLKDFDGSGVRARGGVSSLRLIPAPHITHARVNDSRQLEICLREGAEWATFGFSEDTAYYSETCIHKKGGIIYSHVLSFRFGSNGAEAHEALRNIAGMSGCGIAALITTQQGGVILAGYSERFGSERPLRLHASDSTDGKSPADIPAMEITLASADSAPSLHAEKYSIITI